VEQETEQNRTEQNRVETCGNKEQEQSRTCGTKQNGYNKEHMETEWGSQNRDRVRQGSRAQDSEGSAGQTGADER
jgi:hypothetical protein